ncbi:RAD55 family ATPase [Halegenticoccus tardaugens]|uniref:RAD55 family ATPase n=1 Tax=Halegenticoccus tardaugens TaxID=2071624 RepID=UPI00100B9259|nr:hypothetical protein [Halegenticoccus tardaugens]
MVDDAAPIPLDALPRGSSVLVSGPPMTGKYGLMLRLLARRSERAIVISTDDPAEAIRRDYAAAAGDGPASNLAIVDCTASRRADDADDADAVKRVSSPENLTGIGVKFTELAERFLTDPSIPTGVGFHSLSPLLMYWDVARVYKFVRVLVGQISRPGWTGVGVVNSAMHDERTLHTLYDPFDAIVDTREVDGERELRLRDRRSTAIDWTPF